MTKAWYNRKFFYNTIDIQRLQNADATSFSAQKQEDREIDPLFFCRSASCGTASFHVANHLLTDLLLCLAVNYGLIKDSFDEDGDFLILGKVEKRKAGNRRNMRRAILYLAYFCLFDILLS